MDKVLLLCASHNDLGLIRGLRKLGYYIIATGNNEKAPGNVLVDKWIPADYSDMELIKRIAIEEKVDRICACCNDFGVYTAAFVAEELGFPGYDSYETTLMLHNKDKFKELAEELELVSPKSKGFDDEKNAMSYIENSQFPVIVKPVDRSAGNGISVANNINEAKAAIINAFKESPGKRIVIEQYVEGSQHGFSAFLVNEKVVAFCTNNEYSILNKYRVEIDTFPATEWQLYSEKLINQIELVASHLHLKDGLFHLQYIVSDGEPWILEVMRRTAGNMYHVLGNQLTGLDWEYWEAKARCGYDCSDFPRPVSQSGCFAYKAILAPENGVIKDICIPDYYNKYIFQTCFLMKAGDEIKNNLKEPIGFLFLMFPSMEEMQEVLIDNYKNDCVIMR